MQFSDKFQVGFKNLIGFAVNMWERVEPSPYFGSAEMQFFSATEMI